MSQAHPPFPNYYQQAQHNTYQQPPLQYQQSPGYPQAQYPNVPQDPSHQSFPQQNAYFANSQPAYNHHVPQPPRLQTQPPQGTSINRALITPHIPVNAQHPPGPIGHPGTGNTSHFLPQRPGAVSPQPPMFSSPAPTNSAFQPGSYPAPTTPSPTRRPLPTPNAVPRPVTQPPPSRRPLPAPHASPSAPSSPFRHRPSFSVSSAQSSSAFSSNPVETRQLPTPGETQSPRPLPQPIPRSTKSLDLRSASPMKDILNNSGPQPVPGQRFVPHWKRALPSTPPQPSQPVDNSPSTISRNGSTLRPLPSPGQSQIRQTNQTSPQPPPSRSAFARATSTDETSYSPMQGAIPLRDRSRTLPTALPAPTSALPHRPDSVLPPSRPSNIRNSSETTLTGSSMSSESEDMYENALLKRPMMPRPPVPPKEVPLRTPSPPPTRSRFVERSPERGPGDHGPNGSSNPTRTGRRLSLVSRMAEMSLKNASTDSLHERGSSISSSPIKNGATRPIMSRNNSQPSAPRWPTELPPLPRAPQSQPQFDEQRNGSRNTSPVRQEQSNGHIQPQASPTRSQFSPFPPQQAIECGTSPRFPPPPQHPSSPTRSRFPSYGEPDERPPSRSPVPGPPPPLPPRSNPVSPTRPRFARQAPEREPALPAPRPQRMIPNLDDAPPPSLRRSPSPAPPRNSAFSMNAHSTYSARSSQDLPNIRTDHASRMISPPSGITPSSAGSVFSLSAFPSPPHTTPAAQSFSAFNARSGSKFSPQNGRNRVSFPATPDDDGQGFNNGPMISVSGPDQSNGYGGSRRSPNSVPQISVNGMDDGDDLTIPVISVGGPEDAADPVVKHKTRQRDLGPLPRERSKYGTCCGGCGRPIVGRAVHTADASWHPGCLKCTACDALLVDLAVCEHEGRPYCSLDYYELFAPRCYHCQTAIADPNYITLKDEQLGERTYHEQHFFCAECGNPFLPPSSQPRSFSGEGTFGAGEGCQFIVHNFHPYCEDCHVKLRMPKCKKCSKSLRLDDDKLEFMGSKYCPECFVCKGCDGPFVNGQLFVRDKKPFCRRCYDIIIKSEL